MSVARHHAEWLSLVETSGPFLSMPVLVRVFPQGLERRNSNKALRLREAYEDWLERGEQPAVHNAWIRHVLADFLEYPTQFLAEGQNVPPGIEALMAEHSETLRPNLVLRHREEEKRPVLLIQHYAPEQSLEKPVSGKMWKASPITRMMELLRDTDVPLGLVTNGEQWSLVYAPRGESAGVASWYADLWTQEPITLRAFHSLLHLRRFLGVAEPETLSSLFAESAKDQQEVTEQLGYQVRRAVEMLVQAFSAIETEPEGRALFAGVSEKDMYNAALTVMMRLVFLFCAEERKLLLLGHPLYDQNYAVSTLSEILRDRADQQGEEVLERRHDAWSRLLAIFRSVYGGVEHEAMRLPPYGGKLFDPDTFPFLEGRPTNSQWRIAEGRPLPINNRVVLHLLEALQLLRVKVPGGGPAEARRVSFHALDIEQIGHVYEGLLDHTAKRAYEVVVGLEGSRNAEPEIPLSTLEELLNKGIESLVEFLGKETGRSEKALRRRLEQPPTFDEHALLIACGQDTRLVDRVKRFVGLIRQDDFGRFVVIEPGTVYVTYGSDRRSTGTHYTPRSLTEPIVQHTLEPLVYVGPAEGTPKEQWMLKLPKEILALKVCDMTMGSGAFLVQACRYLGERLVEAWAIAEETNPGKILATPEGDFSVGDPAERLIPTDPAERVAISRRYVADRCLYGVDINPMAVEMAKLSLWLITMQRDRPFTFLDHALKCGDSLLGVSTLKEVENFSLRSGERQITFATANLFRYVEEASAKRRALEDLPSNDHTQIETKNRLHAEAEAATAKVKAIADCLISLELRGLEGDDYEYARETEAAKVQRLLKRDADASLKPLPSIISLSAYAQEQLSGRRTFHWPIEFPEVFALGGFNLFLFNPPFRSGSRISTDTSVQYFRFIKASFPDSAGNTDLCCYFVHRASLLLDPSKSAFGFIATNSISQGDNRASTLVPLTSSGWKICGACPDILWPGTANLFVSWLVLVNRSMNRCQANLNGRLVDAIDTSLTESVDLKEAYPLPANHGIAYKGVEFLGDGFKIDERTAHILLVTYPASGVIRPWLNGADLTDTPLPSKRYAIDFADMSMSEAQKFPECFSIVEREVRPVRATDNRDARRERWWQYGEKAMGMRTALVGLQKALVRPFTSDTFFFRFISTEFLFTNALIVVCRDDLTTFTILNSCFHEVWARQQGSALKMDFRYTPSKCFATFAFPQVESQTSLAMAALGQRLENLRNEAMERRNEGLTALYNRFHDRGELSEDIARLRALHVEMDQTVAAAYGWSDLDLGHGFHTTKQGQRYTISESARRIVLDRLLALNHQRYEEEVKAGLHSQSAKTKSRKRSKTIDNRSESDQQPGLLGLSAENS